jgi:hypothetical protein
LEAPLAVVRQVVVVAPRRAIEEAAPLAVLALGKGKQARVILDDDEVSSDEDEPLQKWLRQLFGAGTAAASSTAATTASADKEAAAKRVAQEAMARGTTEEATVKAAADEEVIGKIADEATGAVRDSPAPGQAPSVAGAKRAVTPSSGV